MGSIMRPQAMPPEYSILLRRICRTFLMVGLLSGKESFPRFLIFFPEDSASRPYIRSRSCRHSFLLKRFWIYFRLFSRHELLSCWRRNKNYGTYGKMVQDIVYNTCISVRVRLDFHDADVGCSGRTWIYTSNSGRPERFAGICCALGCSNAGERVHAR